MTPIQNFQHNRTALKQMQVIYMTHLLLREEDGGIKILETKPFTSLGLAEDYITHQAYLEAVSIGWDMGHELGNSPDGSFTFVGMKAWKIYVLDGLEAHLDLPITHEDLKSQPYDGSFVSTGTAGEAIDAFQKLGATVYDFQDDISKVRTASKMTSFKFANASGFEGEVLICKNKILITYQDEE